MTIPTAPVRDNASAPAAHLLFGLAAVLAVMAVTLLFSRDLSPVPGSGTVCENGDTTYGECLLAVRQVQLQSHLLVNGVTTLAAGALTAALAGFVVRRLPGR